MLVRLRADTTEAHEDLERRLDIFDRISDPPRRLSLVERFCAFHKGADGALAPLLAETSGLQWSARGRSHLFRDDLSALGGPDAAALPSCPFPPPASTAAALGMFYVLEGSSLGGRVIRREVERTGGDMRGLSFLDPYGDQAGPMWKRFAEVLEREAGSCYSSAADDMVTGAREGFKLASAWLCGPELRP